MEVEAAPRFDPVAPEFLANPYPVYERLRAAGPVCRGGIAQWVVARYAEVAALLRDPKLSHEFPELYRRMSLGDGPASEFIERIVLSREGSHHESLRRLLHRVMSATPQDQLRRRVSALVEEILRPGLERGGLDLVEDLALPLPVSVICELIGIPASDRRQVSAWAIELGKVFTVMLAAEDRPSADQAALQLRDYVSGLLDDPGRPSQLDEAAAGDAAGREEAVDNIIFLLLSGFTTTLHLLATAGAILLEHQDQQARLRADRSLVPTAVEEFLRYDAPIQHVTRIVVEPLQVGDQTLRRGRIVHLLLGSANRDERQFPDPDRFDVGRHPNHHVSFGGGRHMCLGATLGRMEAAAAVGYLLDRCAVLEPAGPAVRRPMQVFRAHASVPARVRAA
jgi:cytochrome P450